MFAFLTPYKLYLYGAALAAVLSWGWYEHHAGYASGEEATAKRYEARIAESQAKVAAEDARRSTASTEVGASILTYLQANVPPVEAKTHEAVERVRTIYRNVPVVAVAGNSAAAVCKRPDGVRAELEQASSRLRAALNPVQG